MASFTLAFVIAIGWFGAQKAGTIEAEKVNNDLKKQALFYKEYLLSELDQIDLVGSILSQNPILVSALKTKALPKDILLSNSILKKTNEKMNTSAVYLMNKNGLTVAASNFDQSNSFIGKNYSFRPYFKAAVTKSTGTFLAIGVTSNKLGFYISHALYNPSGELMGVLVIKVDLDNISTFAHNIQSDFLISDQRGVIFLSSNETYQLKSLTTISAKDRLYISRTRQYPINKIQPLNHKSSDQYYGQYQAHSINHVNYFVQKIDIKEYDWQIWLLSELTPIKNHALINGSALSFVTLIALLAFYLLYRRKKDTQRFQTIVDNLPSGVTLFDNNRNLLLCNEMVKKILEFPNSLFKNGMPKLDELVKFNAARGEYGDKDPDEVLNKLIENTQKRIDHVFERTRPDGTILEIRGVWVEEGLITTYTDITERKKAEAEAKRTSGYLRALLQNLDYGVTVIDENLDIIFWNNAFFDLLEFPDKFKKPVMQYEDLIRYNAERGEYGPGDPEQHIKMRIQASLKFEPHKFERTRPDGKTLQVTGKPLHIDGEPFGFISTYVDITEHKRMASRLRKLANTDPLTEINNRRHFTTLFEREIKRCQRNGNPLSLLLLDLDHFKNINDRFGHSVGDKALKAFSHSCRKLLRDIDVMGRLGGEEFSIFLPETSREGAFVLAERIRKAVEQIEFSDHGEKIELTVSIGVAMFDSVMEDRIEDILQRADKALHRAKREGRNKVC
ncbi:PAS-domain containing protein [Candidatus Terasakiella magnetica]|uniref:PAS-domain containing protein n=1 Tax=Candidatus Terasakiella magnetica TaxID=1867952 RepID=UPI000840E5C5|nr:PAS-domain containing protein [Candidatus Terasakiella magnetica]